MLYFRGCTAREKQTVIQEATEKLLQLADVDYHILDDEKCCGSVLLRTGYIDEARKQIEKNTEILKDEKIITSCAVFAPEDMRYYNGELPAGDPDRVFVVVDPSWGGGDYVAATVNYQYGNDIFVHDVVYNNGEKRVTQPEIVDKVLKHKASAIYVEGNKMTSSYGTDIDEILKSKGYSINLQITTKHFTGTGKEQRIFDKAADIRERMIFRSKRSKDYELFMQNVFSFTVNGKNKHDDAPDVCAMTVSFAFFSIITIEAKKRIF